MSNDITKNTILDKQEADLDYSRKTYVDLIEKNSKNIDILLELARDSDHPRVFEVLSNSIKITAEIAEKLVGLHVSSKALHASDIKQLEHKTTNNNLFIGSTEELQELLLGKKSEKVIK